MEPFMREQMTDNILQDAARRYNFHKDSISFLGGFENFVYLVEQEDISYVLRFVHSKHRTYEEVTAEIEFIDYLAHHEASVSTVLHSTNDRIVEQIPVNMDHYFSVSVFEKALGTYVQESDKTPSFWESFGTEVGRLHRLTRDFKPIHKRNHWYQEKIEEMAENCLDDEDKPILKLYQSLKTEIMTFPTNKDNYGLIHTDLHFHNMYYHNGTLTFFDFDDSCYMHFVNDIAIILYYSFQHHVIGGNKLSKDEYNARVLNILSSFMKGYSTQYQLAKEEMKYINIFLRYRATLLYIVLVNSGFKQHEEEGYRRFCERQKQIALNNLMALDLEYILEGL